MADGTAAANNIVVNSLNDTQATDSLCTLREAIINANNDNQSGSTDCATGIGADTITFSVNGGIGIGSTLPIITSNMTIDGKSVITIDGIDLRLVFRVNSGAFLSLQNLAVKHGRGGLFNDGGTVIVSNCTFFQNVATFGGGISNNGGIVTVSNSTFSGNGATDPRTGSGPGFGGGIYNGGGIVTVSNSTFSGNDVLSLDSGEGGGIANFGTLTVTGSTFSRNGAPSGGGIFNGGALTVGNSTFSGNGATGRGEPFSPDFGGGGIANSGTGTVAVTNSTFSGNSSATSGGGIFNKSTLAVTNSIIANSSGGNCDNSSGTLTDGGNNIDNGTTCGFSTATSKSGTNPLLDSAGLKNNGGPTETIALCTGLNAPSMGCTARSPAIDAGSNAVCAAAPVNSVDQRGFVRPVDGDSNGVATCDIGSFESGALPPNRLPVCTNAAADPNTLWPPNHKLAAIQITGVTDPDGDTVTNIANTIFQDEPVDAPGDSDGNTAPDASLSPLQVRAEREGLGNGRVYHINFTASDGHGGSCQATVTVCVPHDQGQGRVCVDGGPLYNSTAP
jgi:CSLREA domain-containing protein